MNLKSLRASLAKTRARAVADASGVSIRTVYRVRAGELPTMRNFNALVEGIEALKRRKAA